MLAVAVAILATALLAVIDAATGAEISFSIFYLLPVALAAWFAGEKAGLAISALCALTWGLIDVSGHEYSTGLIAVWNGTMRGLFFALVTILLARWKSSLARERAAHAELVHAYEELDRTRKEQLQVKDRLLSHVSHELRTPLTALHQFLTILLDRIPGELNIKQEEYLRIAVRNADALAQMISDLLDATRAEAGKLAVAPRRIEIAAVAADVLRTLRSRAAEAGVALEVDPFDGIPPVMADPGRVRQVLVNLLDNAVKFTPNPGRVRIRARVDPSEPSHVRVSVSDTGPGMAPDVVERLFSRLFQEGTQTDASRKGLGLGLYICRELIARQGGRIWVESAPGKGSTFTFTLPIADEAVAASEIPGEVA